MDNFKLKLLIHSPVGHGKTRFLGTATEDARLMPGLLCDVEGGAMTIRSRVETVTLAGLRDLRDPPRDKLVRVRITAWRDLDELYDVLASPSTPYKFVGFDSITELHYLSLAGVIAEELRKNRARDPDVAEQHDYLKSIGQMRKFVRYFRDLEHLHTVYTATTMDVEDARTRRGQARPNLIGKLSSEIPALVDFVGYLGLTEQDNPRRITRVLCTEASDRYVAKARNDEDLPAQLPALLEDPTLAKVLDALTGTPAR